MSPRQLLGIFDHYLDHYSALRTLTRLDSAYRAYYPSSCPIQRHRPDFAQNAPQASGWHGWCIDVGASKEDAMIACSALPFTLRNILNRVGLASTQQRIGLARRVRLNRWQRIIAALGDWSAVSNLAWRSEILLRDRPERFRRFCRDCGTDTPHEGFDEFGAGWYAQVCRCRYCGKQGMRVWPLAWW